MNEPQHGNAQQPVDSVESWGQMLNPSELEALRSTYTWRTNLIPLDLQKLEAVASSEDLRGCVKTLCIEDVFLEHVRTVAPTDSNIRPQDINGDVVTQMLGLGVLKTLLLAKSLCPDRIEIRYRRMMLAPYDPEAATNLARDIFEGAKLAITSFSMPKDTRNTTEIVAKLSTAHQGQDVAFSLLRRADLLLLYDFSSYWLSTYFTMHRRFNSFDSRSTNQD
ncbi:hypothetical protein LTR17_006123 [Elasticomyces elasticus]|nr:hypothetical protein LTR17_006123 [Elasticomyces elasticus]